MFLLYVVVNIRRYCCCSYQTIFVALLYIHKKLYVVVNIRRCCFVVYTPRKRARRDGILRGILATSTQTKLLKTASETNMSRRFLRLDVLTCPRHVTMLLEIKIS